MFRIVERFSLKIQALFVLYVVFSHVFLILIFFFIILWIANVDRAYAGLSV